MIASDPPNATQSRPTLLNAAQVAFAPTGQSSYVIIANSRVIGQAVYKTAGWCNGLEPAHVRDTVSDQLPAGQWLWETLIKGQAFPYFIDQENLRQAIADHLNQPEEIALHG